MTRIGLFMMILSVCLNAAAQDIKTKLDSLNEKPFRPEGRIRGTGLVSLNSYDTTREKELVIYDRHGKVKFSIHPTPDEIITKHGDSVYTSKSTSNPLRPILFLPEPDHFRLTLDCVRKLHATYDVVIDEATRETGFIKISDPAFKFQTVTQYVEEWIVLGFDFDRIKNPLRQGPFDNAITITNPQTKKYRTWPAKKLEIRGDWVKVRVMDKEVGWVRWKRANEVWIKLYFVR